MERSPVKSKSTELEATTSWFSHVPPWFVAAFGAIYLSGYLIEILFYSYFGIVDTDNQLLKMNYIVTGLEFFVLYMLIFSPLYFYFGTFTAMFKNIERSLTSNVVLALIGTVWPFSVFAISMFTPVWFFHLSGFHRVLLFFLYPSTLVFYMVIAWITRNHRAYRWTNALISLVGVLILAIIFTCDYLILRDTPIQFNKTISCFFVTFVCIAAFTAKRLELRLIELAKVESLRIEHVAFISTFGLTVIVCFFLSLFTYAYGIFPTIPNAKGGADYTLAPRITVTLKDAALGERVRSGLIQVYATSSAIYVAYPKFNNDACSWRRRRALPIIVEVMRDEISTIEISPLNTDAGEDNCVLYKSMIDVHAQVGRHN